MIIKRTRTKRKRIRFCKPEEESKNDNKKNKNKKKKNKTKKIWTKDEVEDMKDLIIYMFEDYRFRIEVARFLLSDINDIKNE